MLPHVPYTMVMWWYGNKAGLDRTTESLSKAHAFPALPILTTRPLSQLLVEKQTLEKDPVQRK